MKALENVDPKELIQSAATTLLQEKRHDAESRIKQILIRQESLAEQLRAHQNSVKKAQEAIDKGQRMIERLANGDWSVLADNNNKPQEPAANT